MGVGVGPPARHQGAAAHSSGKQPAAAVLVADFVVGDVAASAHTSENHIPLQVDWGQGNFLCKRYDQDMDMTQPTASVHEERLYHQAFHPLPFRAKDILFS